MTHNERSQCILPGCDGYDLKKDGRPIRMTQSIIHCPECNGSCVIVVRTHDRRVPGRRKRMCQVCGYVWFTQEVDCS